MASTITGRVDVRPAARAMTIRVKVRGMKRTRVRLLAVSALFRIAGWVSPCPVEVSTD